VEALAPAMTLLTYIRRVTVSIAALAVSRHAVDPDTTTMLEQFADGATTRLDMAAARLDASATPASSLAAPPVREVKPADPVVRARLTRLSRQLDTLVGSADEVAAMGEVEGNPRTGAR
jgi:hypothetical protein